MKEQYEPSADARVSARAMRDLFLALRQEGFTEAQALSILGSSIAAAALTRGEEEK